MLGGPQQRHREYPRASGVKARRFSLGYSFMVFLASVVGLLVSLVLPGSGVCLRLFLLLVEFSGEFQSLSRDLAGTNMVAQWKKNNCEEKRF